MVVEGILDQVKDLPTIEAVIKANIEKLGLNPDEYLEKRMAYYTKTLKNPKGVKIFKIKAKEMKGRKMRTTVGT